jgi:hypothetical protein
LDFESGIEKDEEFSCNGGKGEHERSPGLPVSIVG